ncbi:MAG: hypothetical protein Q9227_004713 [Pyrenula ochraceoflavens]
MAGSIAWTRPSGCWKSILREKHIHRPPKCRSFVTITHDKPVKLGVPKDLPEQYWSQLPPRLRPDRVKKSLTLPPQPPSIRRACPSPLSLFNTHQLTTLDPTSTRTTLFSPSNPERANPGDILHVTFRNGEPFSGVFMEHRSRGPDSSIRLRNHLTAIGAEMLIKVYSPLVTGIEVAQRAQRKARRRRLTYLRKVEHDVGDVGGVVSRYLRMKAQLAGGKGALGMGQERKKLKNGNKPKKRKR